jgi:hypothetical protein
MSVVANSSGHGTGTLAVEVTNISQHGIWLILHDKEYYLPYSDFPWFRNARVSEILAVELLHDFHLQWPALDVDLEMASLDDPSRYPLVYQEVTAR